MIVSLPQSDKSAHLSLVYVIFRSSKLAACASHGHITASPPMWSAWGLAARWPMCRDVWSCASGSSGIEELTYRTHDASDNDREVVVG